MPEFIKSNWIFFLVITFLSILYLSGYQSVPFHPDESTHIYMSSDFNFLISDPLSMSYTPMNKDSNRTFLRSLGAPLTKYLLGLTLAASGLEAPNKDWDWSQSWTENIRAGALPESKVINMSRLTTTIMTLAAHLFLYYCVKNVWGKPTALLSVLLMGLNPLILLHGRRAMNEASALLGVSAFIWLLTLDNITPLLTGLVSASSFNAKQILLLLFPVGIIAVYCSKNGENKPMTRIHKIISYAGVFFIVTWLFNPYYWTHPIDSFQHSLKTIQELQSSQLNDFYRAKNKNILQTTPYRVLAITGNLYFSPLGYSDVGNYDQNIAGQIQRYEDFSLNTLGRNQVIASLLITISSGGFIYGFFQLSRKKNRVKKKIFTLLLTSILLFLGVLFLQPVPWQRYVITLIPLTTIWTAVGLQPFIQNMNICEVIQSSRQEL